MTPSVVAPGIYISRVTNKKTEDGEETVNQQEVKEAIHRIQEKYPDKEIEKFFNVAAATCTPVFKDSDLLSVPRFAGDVPKSCKAKNNAISTPGVQHDKVNFITLLQEEDVGRSKRPKSVILPQLRKLFHAVAYLNNENVIHTDAHMNNIAWMGDRIVMHDWGRAAVGIKGFKDFYKRYELDKTQERRYMSQWAQFRGPCTMMETCPIKLSDDSTSHRFMKFYDVASLAAGGEQMGFFSPLAVKRFGEKLTDIWKNNDRPTNQIMNDIHTYIDELFDEPQAAPPAAPVVAPVPVPDVVSGPSYGDMWIDWIGSNQYKKVILLLRDRPGVETKITVRVYATVQNKWAIFELDLEAKAILEGAGYPTRTTWTDMNPPGITMLKSAQAAPEVIPKLFLPISFLSDDKVIMNPDAPLSSLSMSSWSVPPPPGIQRAGARKLNQTQRFCKCIKKVRKTIKNEKGPIAICVKSVLQTKGRTLKRFTCGKKGRVITQKALRG